jgi:choline dehydrogenase-like flavoprotein
LTVPSRDAATFDAIVVGSGMTGGWAAKELTELGLRTLVLEAGGPVDPERDFLSHVPAYQLRFRGMRDVQALKATQPVQMRYDACDELASRFFVNDIENPYSTPQDKPFLWIRGRQVGGRSITWARQTYRLSDLDFELNARAGHAPDWPIRYADLAPWYDHVEGYIGVSGMAEGLAHLPDGPYLPPMPLNCAEELARDRMRERFGRERLITIGRCAVLTQPHRGRDACRYCGPCHRGCRTLSYFSSNGVTLPAAARTGRLTLRPHSVVERLLYDHRQRRVTAVRVIDAQTHQIAEYRARVVFLCASALESTRLLLHSASDEFPSGLANSSGELGRNLMDHVMGGGASGVIPGLEDRREVGRRPTGVYIPRFRNLGPEHSSFVGGYHFFGFASRKDWRSSLQAAGFGADFQHGISRLGPWQMQLIGMGECLPSPENRIELDPTRPDAWGIPSLRISCAWGDNERALRRDMSRSAAEILDAIGARDVTAFEDDAPPGMAVHEMGTARMGRDARTSVVNGHNQAHDIRNLFLTDGAVMASSANQNPSLTYMAMTARACHYAVEAMRRREL